MVLFLGVKHAPEADSHIGGPGNKETRTNQHSHLKLKEQIKAECVKDEEVQEKRREEGKKLDTRKPHDTYV